MNVGDEDVMSGFATLLPGAEGADEDAAAGEYIETDSGLTLGLQERMMSCRGGMTALSLETCNSNMDFLWSAGWC
jgi:hypothetical protein